jgi:DNA polymerase-3 subunit epsilon
MDQKFAFVDIETTGSNPVKNRVIEVAIVRIQGDKLVDRWSTLVNPGMPIPSFIRRFTGIDESMLIDKPIFEEIADEILSRLEGYVFVAHNVRFDYGFLKNEFKRVGKDFRARQLCTVKLSRKLYHEYRKHNLDAVMQRFDLEPVTDRHRALGDADLLYQFWKQIHDDFEIEDLNKAIQAQKGQVRIPSKVQQEEFEKLPKATGVYFFYGDDEDRPIYIGKSKNIRERVLSHFTQEYRSFRKTRMVNQIKKIDYVRKPGELSALLYESDMVKKHLPIYNKRLRKTKTLYLLNLNQKDLMSGLLTVNVRKTVNPTYDELENSFGPFRSKAEIESFLESIVKEYKLCRQVIGLEKTNKEGKACFNFELGKCMGACNPEISDKEMDKIIDKHNTLLKTSLEREQYEKWPFQTPIAIREINTETGDTELHLVNNWCLIGTYKSMDALYEALHNSEVSNFDVDKYKLLKSFVKRNEVEIIEL